MAKRYSNETIVEVLRRRAQGESIRSISRDTGISRGVIGKWPNNGGKRYPQKVIDTVRHSVQQGASKKTVAKELQLSYKTVLYWTVDLKTRVRPYPRTIRDQAVIRVRNGEERRKVADELGIKIGTVFRWTKDVPIETIGRPSPIHERAIELVKSGLKPKEVDKLLGLRSHYASELTRHLRPPRRKFSQEFIAAARARVANGESKQGVDRALGLPLGTVKKLTKDIRPRATPTRVPDEAKKEFEKRVAQGETQNAVARAIGFPKAAHLGRKLMAYVSGETIEQVRQALSEGQHRSQVALELQIPKRSVDLIAGIRTSNRYTKETRGLAVKAVESGEGIEQVAERLGVRLQTVRLWYRNAVKAGTAKPKQKVKSKREDFEFEWIAREYPHLELWRLLCTDWLKGEHRSLGSILQALSDFVINYLVGQNLPSHPADLLKRGTLLPDYYMVACPQSPGGIAKNNHIHHFLEWVLRTPDFSDHSEGEPIPSPAFRNPVPKLSTSESPRNTETNKTLMSYWLIQDLRQNIAAGPHFSDWTWVQSLLGCECLDGSNAGSDWYEVKEDQIDKDDRDCVWRRRLRTSAEPILEMWSPVRWVALLVKLQTTARMGQIRVSDSGEGDTFIYREGTFIRNDSSLARGTERDPWRQGVFRQPDPGDKDAEAQLFFNTNKTQDILKVGEDKGQECPWPHFHHHADDPYYWLERLCNWQRKYNPIDNLTSWRNVPVGRNLTVKSEFQNAEYPDTAFLFRTPETPNQTHLPLSSGMADGAWQNLCVAYEQILKERVTHPDGTPIRLIDPKTGRAETSMHGLRPSLITHLILDGDIKPELMMKIVGHKRLIMTIYYTKPGLKHIQDAIAGACAKLDKNKEFLLVRDLAGVKAEQMRSHVVFNAEDWTTVLAVDPADRNPLGWLYMHDGICLAGGNPGPLNGSYTIPGCHNGGTLLKKGRGVYGPVPGGVRNCTRCRWKCSGKHHAYGLSATLNNRLYHYEKQKQKAVATEREHNELLKQKARDEAAGIPFSKMTEFKSAERLHEAAMVRMGELAKDVAAISRTIERVKALPDKVDGTMALAMQGDLLTLHTVLDETDSELLILTQICEDVEFFPELDPGVAVFELAQMLDHAFEREGYPMVFARMSESEKLTNANAFMRALENLANPHNPILARRKVVQVLDRQESLEQVLGVKLNELLLVRKEGSEQVVSLRLVSNKKEAENDPRQRCTS